MIIYFIFSHDLIQKAVKLETSLLAKRRNIPTQDGVESLFDDLVMDEDYDVLFRRLFAEAHAEVVRTIPPKMIEPTPTDLSSIFTEFEDFRQDRDFALWVDVNCDFPMQYKKSIDTKIEMYLIDYICYRWFETKSPQDSMTYYSRLNTTLNEIVRLLTRRTIPLQKKPSFP